MADVVFCVAFLQSILLGQNEISAGTIDFQGSTLRVVSGNDLVEHMIKPFWGIVSGSIFKGNLWQFVGLRFRSKFRGRFHLGWHAKESNA